MSNNLCSENVSELQKKASEYIFFKFLLLYLPHSSNIFKLFLLNPPSCLIFSGSLQALGGNRLTEILNGPSRQWFFL